MIVWLGLGTTERKVFKPRASRTRVRGQAESEEHGMSARDCLHDKSAPLDTFTHFSGLPATISDRRHKGSMLVEVTKMRGFQPHPAHRAGEA